MAAAALFAAAFLIGRFGPQPPDPIAFITEQASASLFALELNEHLGQTQIMIEDLSNLEENSPLYIEDHRAMATELLTSNRIYRNIAFSRGDTDMAEVLGEIELLLIDLANTEESVLSETLLSDREAHAELLFHLRVIRANLKSLPQNPNLPISIKTI